MNKKQQKLVVIGAALLVLFAAALLLTRPGGETINQRVKVPESFKTAAPYGDGSIVMCNNRAFVSYNPTTGDSNLLSADDPANGLTGVESLSASPDGKYLLFHTEQTQYGSVLDTYLQAHALDNARDYWWVYSISQKTYHTLPANSLLAKFDGPNIHVLAPGSNGEAITTYALTDLSQVASLEIPGSTDFWKYGEGFVLQLPDNSVTYTTDGVITTSLFKDMTLVTMAPGTDKALATRATENTSQLVALDLKKKSQQVVDEGLIGQPGRGPDGTVLYQVSNKDGFGYIQYDAATGTRTPWRFGDELKGLPSDDAAKIIGIPDAHAALISDGSDHLFLAGQSLHEIKDITSYSAQFNVGGQASTIESDENTNDITVSSYIAADQATIVAAYGKMKTDGINPDIYPVRFVIYDE
jgi:hypothetical protein